MIYLDTSALIKRFVEEKGSALVQSMVESGEAVATSKIAYAEVFSGLTRKMREGAIRIVLTASPPNVFIGGPDSEPPGFPLNACGNDGLRIDNELIAASCGESTHGN